MIAQQMKYLKAATRSSTNRALPRGQPLLFVVNCRGIGGV
jgi:hypothetical protein